MRFSERNGYRDRPLQLETMSPELKNRIWNVYRFEVDTDTSGYNSNYLEDIMDSLGLTFRIVYNYTDLLSNLRKFEKWFEQAEWYEVYDFIEIYLNFLPTRAQSDARKNFNNVLKQENAGYRIAGVNVVAITNEKELQCIETAQETAYDSVNIHIQKATELYAKRPIPDYENSIKESISAVEAMCCIITGMTGKQATLGNAIKKLKDCGVHIHSAMESAFSSLYGYTSDENGIRHGGIDFANTPAEDAKYMLISCSAFVNYIIEKWSKINPEE